MTAFLYFKTQRKESGVIMKLFGTAKINKKGHLEIGKCDAVDLVKEYGTPLYVMDENLIRNNCKVFKEHFKCENIETEVIYASKAFMTMAMCKLIEEEGLSLDVVSGGELYTALAAGFPSERIFMHGNNKTEEEICMAIESGVGRIVVDNVNEIDLLKTKCKALGKRVRILLRVNPGIEVNTHEYIKTTKNSSKFGISIYDENAIQIINKIKESSFLEFMGFHCHIGSQILQEESYYETTSIMFDFIKNISHNCDLIVKELNLGGGFGIYYSNGDTLMDLKKLFKNILSIIKDKAKEFNIPRPKTMIEPGRAIVANAGTTLYLVGSTKKTYSGKHYVFVDGSMNDNMRTALYDAKYEAAIANRMNDEAEEYYTITGRCCESGDMIVKNVALPHPKIGDIVAVSTTGAYNYSMSGNYNRLPKPPVIFVKDGNSRYIVKRETYDDIIRNDII